MLKWLIITSAVIIISLLVYKFILYPQIDYIEVEKSMDQKKVFASVNYIVTSDVSGRISIREIDSFTSEKNFPFTRYNMKPELSKKISQERI